MNVIEINTKDNFLAELKSWLWSLASILVFVTLAVLFLDFQLDKKWLLIAVPLAMTLANTITQYHVHAVSIEKETNTFLVTLKSIMSGSKIRRFALDKVEVSMTENNGLRRIIHGPIVIKLLVSNDEIFRVTKRYGFSTDKLKLIVEKIQCANMKS